ncbi:MAG: hypothetical protein ACI9OJ_000825 [Myxococcota bacterium]|jgi:hypothetical protein
MAMTTEARKRVFKRWAIGIAVVGLIAMPGVHLLLTWLDDEATEDVVAFVMYFHQAKTPEAEASMTALTGALISRSLQLGGRYYLPYRRHATNAQLLRAYPMWPQFVAAKRKYDPTLRFRNQFFNQYEKVGQ